MAAVIGDNRLQSLDALRGLAALLVVICHSSAANRGFLPPGPLNTALTYGVHGLEMFFVISGFVIPYSMWRASFVLKRHGWMFILKREARLAPPYLASMLIAIAIAFAASQAPGYRGNPPSYSLGQLLSHLGYVTGLLGYDWVIGVYWTLAIEFQYYLMMMLLFPLLCYPLLMVRIAAVVVLIYLSLMPVGTRYLLIFPYLSLFAMGIVVFQTRAGLMGRIAALPLLAGSGLATAWSLGNAPCLAGMATALIILFYQGPVPRALIWLGTISYSLYLIHLPLCMRILNLSERWERDTPLNVLIILVAVAVSILAGWIFHRLIEAPSLKLSKRFAYGSRDSLRGPIAPEP